MRYAVGRFCSNRQTPRPNFSKSAATAAIRNTSWKHIIQSRTAAQTAYSNSARCIMIYYDTILQNCIVLWSVVYCVVLHFTILYVCYFAVGRCENPSRQTPAPISRRVQLQPWKFYTPTTWHNPEYKLIVHNTKQSMNIRTWTCHWLLLVPMVRTRWKPPQLSWIVWTNNHGY